MLWKGITVSKEVQYFDQTRWVIVHCFTGCNELFSCTLVWSMFLGVFYYSIRVYSFTICSRVSSDSGDSSSKWRHVRGRFTAINAALVSGRCSRTVTGMSPAAHLGNGCLDLVLVRQCSRFDYLRHMLKLASSGNHVSHLYFIERIIIVKP